jgi:hypothetical protein
MTFLGARRKKPFLPEKNGFIPVPVIWMIRKEVLKENLTNEPTEIGRNHESHVKKNVLLAQINFSPVQMIFSPTGKKKKNLPDPTLVHSCPKCIILKC